MFSLTNIHTDSITSHHTHTYVRTDTYTVRHTYSSSCSLSSSTLTPSCHVIFFLFVPRKLAEKARQEDCYTHSTSSLLFRSTFLYFTVTVPKLTSTGVPNILENFASPIINFNTYNSKATGNSVARLEYQNNELPKVSSSSL